MPKQYFNIPLADHAGLVELQAYLRTKLGESARYSDPATFHLTLAYVPDESTPDLTDMVIPSNIPVFGVRGEFWRIFNTPDGFAVTIRMENLPLLTHLQASTFYALRERGVAVSDKHWPALWVPHITLAYTDEYPDLDVLMPGLAYIQASEYVLTGDGYQVLATWPLRSVRASGEPVSEMAVVREITASTTFKGSYPTVPTFSDVDVSALTSGDDNPMFVTLPIAEDDSTSGNNRFYSAAVVRVIREQVRDRRPTGEQGHPDLEKLGTSFNSPKIYWLGETKVGTVLWGKGYIPPGETRDMITRLKAVNGEVATSILAIAETEWDSQRGVWNIQADGFDLKQIDIAPAYMAGVRSLKRVPHITSEMVVTDVTDNEEIPDMGNPTTDNVDRVQVIRELTAADAAILPEMVRSAVLENAPERRVISEMRSVLSIDENADVVAEMRKVQKAYADLRTVIVEQEIVNQVTDKVKVESRRTLVADLVRTQKPETVEAVAEMVTEVMDREHVKSLLSETVVGEMGPNQQRPGGDGEGEPVGMLDAKSMKAIKGE